MNLCENEMNLCLHPDCARLTEDNQKLLDQGAEPEFIIPCCICSRYRFKTDLYMPVVSRNTTCYPNNKENTMAMENTKKQGSGKVHKTPKIKHGGTGQSHTAYADKAKSKVPHRVKKHK